MMIHTQHSPIHSSLYIFFFLYFPPFFFFFLFFLFSLFHSFFLLGLQIKSSYTGIPDLARSFSLFFISRPVLFASCVLLSTDFDRLTRSFFFFSFFVSSIPSTSTHTQFDKSGIPEGVGIHQTVKWEGKELLLRLTVLKQTKK